MFLLGFGMGIILATFHMCGMVFVFSEMLNICVRRVIALGPRCFKCLMLMLSGPVELLFRDCFIACCVCSSVMGMCVDLSRDVFLSIVRWFLCVECLIMLVNCLLKCSVFCLLVVAFLLLKVMVVLGACLSFLFDRPASVFQSLCDSVLWFQGSVICCFQSSCLWC